MMTSFEVPLSECIYPHPSTDQAAIDLFSKSNSADVGQLYLILRFTFLKKKI